MQTKLVSRIALARELGVEPRTIAKWERHGWFPEPRMILSDRVILYARSEIEAALLARQRRKRARLIPVRKRAS
jgi:predicted DNA-binding transcriptional regulator AlpA